MSALRDIAGVLARAEPEDKAELYMELGVELAYYPDGRVALNALTRGVEVRVGGGLEHTNPGCARGAASGRTRP